MHALRPMQWYCLKCRKMQPQLGIPARMITRDKKNAIEITSQLDHSHIPDPVSQQICQLQGQIERLEKMIEKMQQPKKENNIE